MRDDSWWYASSKNKQGLRRNREQVRKLKEAGVYVKPPRLSPYKNKKALNSPAAAAVVSAGGSGGGGGVSVGVTAVASLKTPTNATKPKSRK